MVGLLAAELDLLPRGNRISAAELLAELQSQHLAPTEGLTIEAPLRRIVAAQLAAPLGPAQI